MNLKTLRNKCSQLKKEDKEIYEIASSIPKCEGTGSFEHDEYDYLECTIKIFKDIKNLIKRRCELNEN
jgi:hypothetical protein